MLSYLFCRGDATIDKFVFVPFSNWIALAARVVEPANTLCQPPTKCRSMLAILAIVALECDDATLFNGSVPIPIYLLCIRIHWRCGMACRFRGLDDTQWMTSTRGVSRENGCSILFS